MMGNNEGNVEETLKQRGSVYGDYKQVCKTRAEIMAILKEHYRKTNSSIMPDTIAIAFSDMVLKLVRAAGAPGYADSYHDLCGYSKLLEDWANLPVNNEIDILYGVKR